MAIDPNDFGVSFKGFLDQMSAAASGRGTGLSQAFAGALPAGTSSVEGRE